MITLALVLSLATQLDKPTPSLSRPAADAAASLRMLCEVTPELKVAVLHGTDAEAPAALLLGDLGRWECLRVFSLPVSIPMHGDALPEGAARIADRVGVDWIITVSPETAPGYVTARLIEVSNLGVVSAKTGGAGDVALALLTPVRDEMRTAMETGVRVTITLDPATFANVKALQNAMYGQPNFVEVGNPRLYDGKGQVMVKYKGSVDALAGWLDGKDLKGTVVEVSAVKLRRIELVRAQPTSDQ